LGRPKRRNRKGTGQVVKAGRTWGIRYTEGGQRRYTGGYLAQDDARQALDVIVAQIKAGLPGVPKKPKAPAGFFHEVLPDYWTAKADMRSVQDDRNRWAKHLRPLLEHRRIDSVDTVLVDELVADLKGKLDPGSVEHVLYTLSGFYRWTIRRKLTTHNPVREYLASLERTERRRLRTQHDPKDTPFIQDRSDIAKVFQHLPSPINIAYALSALAGLRPGEVVGVEWADVDLDAAKLTVRRRVRHGNVDVPKSGKPRVVPLVPSLVTVLKAWKAQSPKEALVVPPRRRKGHLGTKSIKKPLDAVLTKLKLTAIDSDTKKRRPLTFYEAGRHSFASQWVLAGIDIYRLSEILGHASVTTTMRYAHLTQRVPDAILAAADIKLAG
jgi:integrase